MMAEFFKRAKSDPNLYSHCYLWMPILFKCTQIDFIGMLIHSIRSDDENKILLTHCVISNWRNDPTSRNNYYVYSNYT
jgi:hypothetical protein